MCCQTAIKFAFPFSTKCTAFIYNVAILKHGSNAEGAISRAKPKNPTGTKKKAIAPIYLVIACDYRWFRIALATSSAEAYSVPANPADAQARPMADVSQTST